MQATAIRRTTEEQLAEHVGRLARKTEALDDFAGLVAHVTGEFPIPPDALRLILRNLLANAIAAGAERIHVSALGRGDQRILVVDDDGVGLASTNRYATGAQLGLRLCRRLVERCGGVLELRPRAVGGTRAVIVAAGAGT